VVFGKNDKESFVIIIRREYILLVDTSDDDVIDSGAAFDSGYPRHKEHLCEMDKNIL